MTTAKRSTNVVEIYGGNFRSNTHGPYISSLKIAREAHLTHAWVLRTVNKHLDSLTHGGEVRFVGGFAILNVAQAWLFMGFLRNTEDARRLKLKVAHDFIDACSILEEKFGFSPFTVAFGDRS